MTTEIAIMNKCAVALAADSAVTVTGSQGNSYKVLNIANKLFSLSKCAPVGLMIYGNASMLGIPWETIVKMYREHLRNREFSTLTDYCKDFFAYLDGFDVTDAVQQQYVKDGATELFQNIKNQLDEWVQKEIDTNKIVSSRQIEAKLTELIKVRYDEFVKLGEESVLSKTIRSNLRKGYRTKILNIAKSVFEQLPLTTQMHSHLLTIALNAAAIGPLHQSGVVIAGFGTKDLCPICQNFDVAAIFAGKTIKRDGKAQAITHDMGAAIIPFAQSDDVRTFMEGIGPVLDGFLKKVFYGIMVDSLPDCLRDEIATK